MRPTELTTTNGSNTNGDRTTRAPKRGHSSQLQVDLLTADLPEVHQQQVVELVLADGLGHGDEEGLAEQRHAGVVVARLLELLPQVDGEDHVVRVLLPVYRQLEPGSPQTQREPRLELGPLRCLQSNGPTQTQRGPGWLGGRP